MAKKSKGKLPLIIILVIVVLLLGLGGFFYFNSSKDSHSVSVSVPPLPEPILPDLENLSGQDSTNIESNLPAEPEKEPASLPQQKNNVAPTKPTKTENPSVQTTKQKKNFNNLASIFETQSKSWQLTSPQTEFFAEGVLQVVLIQNNNKLDYTIIPEKPADWSLLRKDDRLQITFFSEKEAQNDILSRRKKGKYAVQVISVEAWRVHDAVSLVERLVSDGYYAYIHRTNSTYKGEYWYRVRVGTFVTEQDANIKGKEIYYRYRDFLPFESDYWVVLPTDEELTNTVVNLKTVKNNSWVIRLAPFSKWKDTLITFDKLNKSFDFIYISRTIKNGKFVFYLNLGLYETREEAQKQLRTIHDIDTKLRGAKIRNLAL